MWGEGVKCEQNMGSYGEEFSYGRGIRCQWRMNEWTEKMAELEE